MIEKIDELMEKLEKSRAEFDIAATCVAQALQSMWERMDGIELWIEEQKSKMQK